MDFLLDESVSQEEVRRFEQRFNAELEANGRPTPTTQFEYAWCLVRSAYPADIKRGLHILESMLKAKEEEASGKRDYLYYMAVGNARLKEYATAISCVRALLQVQPENRQALELESLIERRMRKEGLIGMAVVGGATLAFGALVGVGIALAKGVARK